MREVVANGLVVVVVSGLLLALPAAAAAGAQAGDQTTGDEIELGEGLTWFAPEKVRVGHPVHAAVAVLTGDGLATSMHQDLTVWVTLDDEVLLHTPSVHEHQGLHLVTVTPQKPGILKFWADDGSGGHGDHRLDSLGSAASVSEPSGMSAEVEVVGDPLAPMDLPRLGPVLEESSNGRSWILVPQDDTVPYSSMITMSDEAGRLIFGGWPVAGEDGSSLGLRGVPGEKHADALLLAHPGSQLTPFSQTLSIEGEARDPDLTPGAFGPPLVTSCEEATGRLVLDPNSVLMTEEVRAWQEWSDVRIHYLDLDRMTDPEPSVVTYRLYQWPLGVSSPESAEFRVQTDHPFAYVAFRPPEPGNYALFVGLEDGEEWTTICTENFRVLPEPAAIDGPGELAVDLEVDGDLLAVDLRSERDGEALPHYEFDVQVVRLDDDQPATLAWRGKLHGHAGEVSFLMSSLSSGDYEMRVHPSPQDPGIAPLAAGPEGFVYPFTVDGANTLEFEKVATDAEALPSPVGLVLLAIAGLVSLVALRRRV